MDYYVSMLEGAVIWAGVGALAVWLFMTVCEKRVREQQMSEWITFTERAFANSLASGAELSFAAIDARFDGLPDSVKKPTMEQLPKVMLSVVSQMKFDDFVTRARLKVPNDFIRHFKIESSAVPLTITRLGALWAYEDLISGTYMFPLAGHDTGIALRNGEQLVFTWPTVSLVGEVSHREYISHSSGGSARVAKGLSVHSSGTRARSYTVKENEVVDRGSAYVTTEAFVFTGAHNTSRVPFKNILSVEDLGGQLRISVDRRAHPLWLIMDLSDFAAAAIHWLGEHDCNGSGEVRTKASA